MVSVVFLTHLVTPFRKFLWLAFFSKKVTGGDDGIRTHDPLLAGQVLSQLSYTPIKVVVFSITSYEVSLVSFLFKESNW